MKLKTCTKCNIVKDIPSFPLNKSGKDGINPSCKECKFKDNVQIMYNAIEYIKRNE